MMGRAAGSAGWAGAGMSIADEFGATDHSTTGESELSSEDSCRDAVCPVFCRRGDGASPVSTGRNLCGDGALTGNALFKCNRDVAPNLDGENDRGREQQGSDGDMDDG